MNFSIYWQHADAVSKSLYFILLALSIVSWVVFVLRFTGTKKIKQTFRQNMKNAINALQGRIAHFDHGQRKSAAEQALIQQIGREKSKADQGIAVLGTIASVAPFVGLFGTVWGIFHALVAIGSTGQAGLAQVATPVGEALIMTALGLTVAIPAVFLYNICTRQNRTLAQDLQDQAHDLLIDVIVQESK